MADPSKILDADDYKNYRNVRAVALFYMLLGGIFLITLPVVLNPDRTKDKSANKEKTPDVAYMVILPVMGLGGLIGGAAIRWGNRKLSPLIYGIAVPYLLAFPIGTILSLVVLKGLGNYFDSVDLIATKQRDEAN